MTLRPRLSSRHPILAAAIPLPRKSFAAGDEYVFCHRYSVTTVCIVRLFRNHHSFVQRRDSPPILRCVDPQRLIFRFHHANAESIFECAQLLQPFGLFERPDRKIRIGEQKIPAIDVQADVLEVDGLLWIAAPRVRNAVAALVPMIGNGRAPSKWRCG